MPLDDPAWKFDTGLNKRLADEVCLADRRDADCRRPCDRCLEAAQTKDGLNLSDRRLRSVYEGLNHKIERLWQTVHGMMAAALVVGCLLFGLWIANRIDVAVTWVGS